MAPAQFCTEKAPRVFVRFETRRKISGRELADAIAPTMTAECEALQAVDASGLVINAIRHVHAKVNVRMVKPLGHHPCTYARA